MISDSIETPQHDVNRLFEELGSGATRRRVSQLALDDVRALTIQSVVAMIAPESADVLASLSVELREALTDVLNSVPYHMGNKNELRAFNLRRLNALHKLHPDHVHSVDDEAEALAYAAMTPEDFELVFQPGATIKIHRSAGQRPSDLDYVWGEVVDLVVDRPEEDEEDDDIIVDVRVMVDGYDGLIERGVISTMKLNGISPTITADIDLDDLHQVDEEEESACGVSMLNITGHPDISGKALGLSVQKGPRGEYVNLLCLERGKIVLKQIFLRTFQGTTTVESGILPDLTPESIVEYFHPNFGSIRKASAVRKFKKEVWTVVTRLMKPLESTCIELDAAEAPQASQPVVDVELDEDIDFEIELPDEDEFMPKNPSPEKIAS